jgi:16S rRNA (cytosine1407-C5)-methyltransferase
MKPEPHLPAEFLDRLPRIVPAERLEQVLSSFAVEKPVTFRINTLRGACDQVLQALEALKVPVSPIPWVTDAEKQIVGFQTAREHRERLTHSSIGDDGKIYIQNCSSMLAPLVLNPQPDEMVLDLAAAPGGKTTQLAQLMNNQGTLSAVEAVRKRMFKLQANLKRCGVENTKTYLADGRSVGGKTPERFDRVLLDAPCSSESRFRTGEPKSWETWSSRKLRETSRKQVGLLKAALHATKIGGEVLYCTCSLAPEENERTVHQVFKKLGKAIEVLPIDLQRFESMDGHPISTSIAANSMAGLTCFDGQDFNPQVAHCLRVLPNDFWDAFFLARIRKLGKTISR